MPVERCEGTALKAVLLSSFFLLQTLYTTALQQLIENSFHGMPLETKKPGWQW